MNIDQEIQLAQTFCNAGKFDEAERLYGKILEIFPHNVTTHNNLGTTLVELGKLVEAERSYRKAIELKSDYELAHFNLANVLCDFKKFEEAEVSYKKAIELKPNFIEALINLGNIQKILKKFTESIISYKKAIEINPMVPDTHNNLGVILSDLGMYDDAETSIRKAIELNPNDKTFLHTLRCLLIQKKLLDLIKKGKSLSKTVTGSFKSAPLNLIDSTIGLSSNPFIIKRKVEEELLINIYKIDFKELNKTNDGRYGNGKCSDFHFLDEDSTIIKTLAEDLTNIMKLAVKSDIFIFDSFLNIYRAGSGTTPHRHIKEFDVVNNLINQKYSLTYYLSIGDQNCSEPGILKLYEPNEEILPSEGTIVIIPSNRMHSAVYEGKTDRFMVGVNFYSLL